MDRPDPQVLGKRRAGQRIARRRRAQLHRQRPPAPGFEHVDAHIRGDAEQPRPQRRPPLEAVERPPGANERLLHGVLSLERRAEHPVAVAGQLGAVVLQLALEHANGGRRGGELGHDRPPPTVTSWPRPTPAARVPSTPTTAMSARPARTTDRAADHPGYVHHGVVVLQRHRRLRAWQTASGSADRA